MQQARFIITKPHRYRTGQNTTNELGQQSDIDSQKTRNRRSDVMEFIGARVERFDRTDTARTPVLSYKLHNAIVPTRSQYLTYDNSALRARNDILVISASVLPRPPAVTASFKGSCDLKEP